jgi:hypothetical protein
MIEPAGKPFTFVDGEVELERVAAAPGRIRPRGVRDHWTSLAEIDPPLKARLDTGGGGKKPRKLRERDRAPVIEVAR